MSLKGTPYYDMAGDAGAASEEEREQLAQQLQHEDWWNSLTLCERIKEKLAGYITPRGFDELIGTELKEVAQLEEFVRLVRVEWTTLESAESEGVVRVEYPCEVHNQLKAIGGEK